MKKLKNRIELAKYFGKLGFKEGAEVGVYEGYYSKVLLDNIPNLKLYCIDSWVGMGHKKQAEHHRAKHMDEVLDNARKRLSSYPKAYIVHNDSVQESKEIKDGSLDFVYIDACHCYDCVRKDIEAWYPKVRVGGIISGDDFYRTPSGNTGVIDAVNEFVKKYNLELFLTEWDHENENADDRQPNFYFFKK